MTNVVDCRYSIGGAQQRSSMRMVHTGSDNGVLDNREDERECGKSVCNVYKGARLAY